MSALPRQLGTYRMLNAIGEGGMARIFLGEHVALGRRVALKMLREPFASHPQANEMFLREAQLAARVRHPNVPEVYDFGADQEGRCFCVMELLEGQSLEARLEAAPPLSLSRGLAIAIDVARALSAVHAAGIVHRDVKPANVFLSNDGQTVKLIDFGIATAFEDAATPLLPDSVLVGSPSYMAPEQIAGDAIDLRVDVYAFGVLLYEMVLGSMPYAGETLRDLLVHIISDDLPTLPSWLPPGLGELLRECLDKDPSLRPSSMSTIGGRLSVIAATYRRSSAVIDRELRAIDDHASDTRVTGSFVPDIRPAHHTVAKPVPGVVVSLADYRGPAAGVAVGDGGGAGRGLLTKVATPAASSARCS